eukprot:TRINITY_DN8673_c0_g2_i1.p1 TRINITY_DN8673_c0_g2~~TRINITY_DN8673_c0_g2_i1.p1  ORF type:complete len:363 (+),score=104.22 TRINITY_DN8673_c0_g2_i1:180-1268(+)
MGPSNDEELDNAARREKYSGYSNPADKEVSRRRQDYLHRLGIQKVSDAQNAFRMPIAVPREAPGCLESARFRAGRFRRSKSDDSTGDENDDENEDGLPRIISSGTFPELFEMRLQELKGNDDFRMQYLARLSRQQVWVPRIQRPPKHQTVIIFDWDDTLLATSYLGVKPVTSVVDRQLKGIETACKRLLELSLRLGQTFIITNAMSGWVEFSAAKYMPGLLPTLAKVPIISARHRFEELFPEQVGQWKVQAFLEVQSQLNSQIITNLISVGDSNFEMDAVHVMGKEFAQALVKTIKFREQPTPEELLKQLELVGKRFDQIVENARNLKIGLERKWNGSSSPRTSPRSVAATATIDASSLGAL